MSQEALEESRALSQDTLEASRALLFVLAERWLSDLLPASVRQDLKPEFDQARACLSQQPPSAASRWADSTRFFQHWDQVLEDPSPEDGVMDALQQALFDGRQVEVVYRKSGTDERRARLHPFGWARRNNVHYLACTFWNYRNPLWLAVHRIVQVTPLADPARPPLAPEQVEDFLSRPPFSAALAELDLELEFPGHLYESLRERPPQGQIRIEPVHVGHFRVHGKVPDSLGLRWWLLGFNDQVRILQPETLQRELQRLLFDPLTGLYNRHEFNRAFQRRLAETARTLQPLTLVLLDLDHFKSVNDTHGHPVGDRVLKQAADRLRESSRDMDVLARHGGEEFALLLPATGETEGRAIAERLREALAGQPLTLDDGQALRVTASFGLASHDGRTTNLAPADLQKRLLELADAALYEAKKAGRNQVRSRPFSET